MKRTGGGNGFRNLPNSETCEWKPEHVKAQQAEAINFGPTALTQEDLAESLGTTGRTLRNWHDLEGWHEAVNAHAWNALGRFLPASLEALGRMAESGSYQHQKLLLQALGLIAHDGVRVENHLHGSNGHKPAGERTQELRRLRGLDPLLFE